ncbi:5-dehydro-4-deoxyglucarate dehydratase [Planococcus halotolerans]|uniref:5-dehydro-4-deoxyglucarate dehydratase n=1 Tax=Planococcus halotolerans TaxID=2233542 RepID=UPI001091F1AB|nr:5-dehydro-4-deoxyglucarate dehydratase [Planococcus halotolerans]QHJ70116.1 5-dehydro-4-deoxyglucarate dehydratase [Planococcus halotolerans]
MGKNRQAPNGILGFPVAPLTEAGVLDLNGLEANIDFLLDRGLTSIFIACGAGELHAISNEEYRSMVEVAVKKTKGKVPLYTGVGGNITVALEQAKISEELGTDGYLILPPYLIDPSQEGLYNYLSEIIESTDLSAIVYNRDNCVMTTETLGKLCEYPQLVGFKDGVGNMETVAEFTHLFGDRLEWINGMPLAEVTMASYMNLGYNSYSSAISNYIPHISALYFEALKNGDKKVSKEIYGEVILPIHRIRKQKKGYAVSLIKAGMKIVGLPVTTNVRAPIAPVEEEHYAQLKEIIEKALEKYPVKISTTN